MGCVYTTNDDAFNKLVEASDVMSTAGGATSISQVAAIAAMNDSRDWGKEFIKHLTENRDYAVDFIITIFLNYMHIDLKQLIYYM